MNRSAQDQAENRLQFAQAALCKVAREISKSDGQQQFYSLTRVQSVAIASCVDRELIPWVAAALVTRPDFEAFYALRDVPGTYSQLRTQLSTPAPRNANSETTGSEFEEQLVTVLDWLDLAADIADCDWSTPGS